MYIHNAVCIQCNYLPFFPSLRSSFFFRFPKILNFLFSPPCRDLVKIQQTDKPSMVTERLLYTGQLLADMSQRSKVYWHLFTGWQRVAAMHTSTISHSAIMFAHLPYICTVNNERCGDYLFTFWLANFCDCSSMSAPSHKRFFLCKDRYQMDFQLGILY